MDENNPIVFSLSPGNVGDSPCGRELIKKFGKQKSQNICLWIIMQVMTLDFYQSLNFNRFVN